jgi:hypothetical protein
LVFGPLWAIYLADCRSATLTDLDSSLQNEKLAFLSLQEVYPEVDEEWANQFVENLVH